MRAVRLLPSAALLAIVVLTIAGSGHPMSAAAPRTSELPLESWPAKPHLTPIESRYDDMAYRATVARDPACDGAHGRQLTDGTPSLALTSTFAVLRRPATSAVRLRALLRSSPYEPPPGNLPSGVTIPKHEMYVNQIHPARTAFGASFYVIPAGNVTGSADVPARCGPERVATLTRLLAHVPRRQRTEILAAQARDVAYLRYLALHGQGICATFVPAGARVPDLVDNLGCATLADFKRWGVAFEADAGLAAGPVFWTVVPDGVATVAVHFVLGGISRSVTITVRAVGNVAVAAEPHGFQSSGEQKTYWAAGFPSTIVLRAADATVIRNIVLDPQRMTTLCGYGC